MLSSKLTLASLAPPYLELLQKQFKHLQNIANNRVYVKGGREPGHGRGREIGMKKLSHIFTLFGCVGAMTNQKHERPTNQIRA